MVVALGAWGALDSSVASGASRWVAGTPADVALVPNSFGATVVACLQVALGDLDFRWPPVRDVLVRNCWCPLTVPQ